MNKVNTFKPLIIFITLLLSLQCLAQTDLKPASQNEINSILVDTLPAPVNYIQFPGLLKEHADESMSYIKSFAGRRREYVTSVYKKDKSFSKRITPILKKYRLPSELRLLVALESFYNPNAVSHCGAVGYWQIMDETAAEFGLSIITKEEREKANQNKNVKKPTIAKKAIVKKDDRKNLSKSTYAAARYLRDRCRNLNNDWLLVVASYNCGVGNVWDAIKKSGKQNASFWDIKHLLPAETRSYVMNFITINVLLHNYSSFQNNELVFETEPLIKKENTSSAQPIAVYK
jgi:membrane-bound lytic murein transglycosylase D